jgi:hypothetical protein
MIDTSHQVTTAEHYSQLPTAGGAKCPLSVLAVEPRSLAFPESGTAQDAPAPGVACAADSPSGPLPCLICGPFDP